jgi:hypothetical protein
MYDLKELMSRGQEVAARTPRPDPAQVRARAERRRTRHRVATAAAVGIVAAVFVVQAALGGPWPDNVAMFGHGPDVRIVAPGGSGGTSTPDTTTPGPQASTSVGPTGPATGAIVLEISGTVVNLFTSVGIPNATVTVSDSANHRFIVGTDKDGKFQILPMWAQVIEPGTIAFVVTKDGYPDSTFSATARPGQPLDGVRITMQPNASGGPSPSAS